MGSNSSSGGGGGGSNRYEPPKKKNPVVEFVKGGGVTGAVVRGVTKIGKSIKEDYNTRKTNEELLGSSDYQGGKTFSGNKVSIAVRARHGTADNNNQQCILKQVVIQRAEKLGNKKR